MELPMPTVQPTFRKVSEVLAPVNMVWELVTIQDGINHEMGPYLKMTMPRAFRGKSIGDVSPGTHIGKSLLLLFGVIPFGYDNITVAQIEPGRMFREESTMTGMRTWIHLRTLEPVDGKTIVTDTITFAPQLPIPGLERLLSSILASFLWAPSPAPTTTLRFLRGRVG
jgi:ligand-binding SRPBCC domain-containing protein